MGSASQPVRTSGIYHSLPTFDPSIKGLTAIVTGANGISGVSLHHTTPAATLLYQLPALSHAVHQPLHLPVPLPPPSPTNALFLTTHPHIPPNSSTPAVPS